MTFKVVHTACVPGLPLEEEIITRTGAEFVKCAYWTEDEIIEAAHDADGIICGATKQPFSRRVIEHLARCRIVANIGIGYDLLDIQACTEHGICAANVPDYCVEEVSVHTMMLMLALNRKLLPAIAKVKEGKWLAAPEHSRAMMPIFRLQGQTLGIVGLGRIGRAIVPKAKGFGMKIIAFSPSVSEEAARGLGVEKVDSLDSLLERADYVSLHAPYRPQNEHMIGSAQLKKMKRTAFLINTARGQLVDEEALKTALRESQIAGAGLDVVQSEPLAVESPLMQMDNVIVTGHSAQISIDANRDLFRIPLEEVARVIGGQWPAGLLNPEVKERYVAKWGVMR